MRSRPQLGGSGWVPSATAGDGVCGSTGVNRRSSSTASTPGRLRSCSTCAGRSGAANPATARSKVTVGRAPTASAAASAVAPLSACTT